MDKSDPRKIALAVLSKQENSHKTLDHIFKEVVDPGNLKGRDRALLNALVYGVLRWRGRLDFLISRFSDKKLAKIDPTILNILRLGLFQIIYMSRIPNSAAVNTSVQLAKSKAPLWVAGFVNGILRHAARKSDRLPVADQKNDPLQAMAIEKSFPPWLIRRWMDRFEPQKLRWMLIPLLKKPLGKVKMGIILGEENRKPVGFLYRSASSPERMGMNMKN